MSTADSWREGGHDTTSHCIAAVDAVKCLKTPKTSLCHFHLIAAQREQLNDVCT